LFVVWIVSLLDIFRIMRARRNSNSLHGKWSPNKRATLQSLDQKLKIEEVEPKMTRRRSLDARQSTESSIFENKFFLVHLFFKFFLDRK